MSAGARARHDHHGSRRCVPAARAEGRTSRLETSIGPDGHEPACVIAATVDTSGELAAFLVRLAVILVAGAAAVLATIWHFVPPAKGAP